MQHNTFLNVIINAYNQKSFYVERSPNAWFQLNSTKKVIVLFLHEKRLFDYHQLCANMQKIFFDRYAVMETIINIKISLEQFHCHVIEFDFNPISVSQV